MLSHTPYNARWIVTVAKRAPIEIYWLKQQRATATATAAIDMHNIPNKRRETYMANHNGADSRCKQTKYSAEKQQKQKENAEKHPTYLLHLFQYTLEEEMEKTIFTYTHSLRVDRGTAHHSQSMLEMTEYAKRIERTQFWLQFCLFDFFGFHHYCAHTYTPTLATTNTNNKFALMFFFFFSFFFFSFLPSHFCLFNFLRSFYIIVHSFFSFPFSFFSRSFYIFDFSPHIKCVENALFNLL